MQNFDITDPLFREAVEAIDAGDETLLQQLINKNPGLISKRLDHPVEGYFRDFYAAAGMRRRQSSRAYQQPILC
jgi:hypothetical protein